MVYILFILLCIFQALDIWHTYLLLMSGIATEANPIMQVFMNQFGIVYGMVVFKAVTMAVLLTVIILNERRKNHG